LIICANLLAIEEVQNLLWEGKVLVEVGSGDGDCEGAIDALLTNVGGVGRGVRCSVGKSSPERAVDVGGNEVGLGGGERAAGSIVGRVTFEVDVECNAALHAATEAGTAGDVIRFQLGVGQVVASRNGSLEISEAFTVTRWG